LWCGIDFTDCDNPDWTQKAIAELERCYKSGAKGVGELSDKGLGLNSRVNSTRRIHLNDPDLQPIFQKCAELGLPVNVHVADPIWSYQKMDSTNDGLMNAYKWRIEVDKEGIYLHDELLKTLEKVVSDNPKTTFIACHFANCDFDLDRLGRYLDAYPNLYTDNSARFGETSVIPRRTAEFYEKYQNRILFGTDMGRQAKMYNTVFRVLESNDEHFYDFDYYNYHWPCNGLNLSHKILLKIYYKNANKILN
jgi:predicted TIM-barrel fold metal-dependent hydrolase